MVGKNNQYVKKIKQGTKVETYSIKKFKVGIASVAIGCSVFFGAGAVAMAGEQTGAPVTVGESNTTVVPKGEERAITGNQSATGAQSNLTPAKEGKIEPEKPKATVNKAKLETLIKEVEGLNLEKYTEESVKGLKTELAKAKEVFETAQNKEEVEAAWRTLFTYKNSKLVVKKTPKLPQDNTPKPDTTNGKETVGIRAENTEPNGTNIAGHNHSMNGTTQPEGSGFRDASTELTDIEWGIKSGFGDSYRTNDRRVFVVRNDDSTFKVPIKIVSGSNNITELTATSASGAALTLTPKNVGSKNAVLTVSGRFSDSKKGSDVINVTVKTGSGQKTFQVGVYHPFQKPTIEVPSNVPQGTTINDYLKDKAGTKPTINVTLPVAPKIPTGAEMKVYLIGSYDSTDYTQDDQNQNPHDYDILATKTVTEGNTTVTIEESDYKKNLPAREIRALTVIELSSELSGRTPDTNPGIRGSYYSDPATVGNPTPAVDKNGAINAITTEAEKQNRVIDSKQNVLTSTEVADFKAMVTHAAQTAKDNINKTDTDTETKVNTERDKGILALDKIGAIVEVEAAKKAKDAAIENNANIIDKQAAKAPIATAASTAKDQINAANAAADVTTAKDAGLLAINKAEAIAEIDAAKAAKDAAIEGNANITDKAAAKAPIATAASTAKDQINAANAAADVTTAKDAGLLAINKAEAIAEIDAAKAAKDAAIEGNANITDKAAAKAPIATAADAAKTEINKDTTNTAALVTTEKEKGILALYKVEARIEIDAALAAKNKKVDINNDLTTEEKAEVKKQTQKEATDAIANTNEATTNVTVTTAKDNGIKAINAVALPTKTVKSEAISEINKALAAKNKTVDANNNLTTEEKSEVNKQTQKEATDAIANINKATTSVDVTTAKDNGIKAINAVSFPTKTVKSNAIEEVKKALDTKVKSIESSKEFIDNDKGILKDKAEKAAMTAIVKIKTATTNAAVETAKTEGIERINSVEARLAVKLEIPELIITKWQDEAGNDLRPADAKAPSELGEANEALAHGEIPGYEYVVTKTDKENVVVTHIFRKLPKKDRTFPEKPKTSNPNKADESQSSAKENVSMKSNLPNTGVTGTNSGLAGLGLAVFGGLLTVARQRRRNK